MSTPPPHAHPHDDIDDLDELVLDPNDPMIDDVIIELYDERQVS